MSTTSARRLLSDLQLVTGVNPYVSGSDNSANDQNTATGITALQEVASRLLRFKASQPSPQDLPTFLRAVGRQHPAVHGQVRLGEGDRVRRQGRWQEVPPEQVVGHFDYILEGSDESLSKQQERSEATQLLNAFAPLAPLGIINLKPIVERVAAAYNISNPESLMVQQQPQAPAAPGPQAPQQPPTLQNGSPFPPQIMQAMNQ
jgi:hypothetical protein